MQVPEDSFSIVEYLSIFTAFIYGFVATRIFSGWGAMINFRHHVRFSKEHLIWTFFTFGLLINIWWGSWIKGNFIDNNTLIYFVSLLPTFSFYFISVFLFPPLNDEKFLDLEKYFQGIRKNNYILFILLFLSLEIGRHFFKNEVFIDFYFNLLAIAMATLGFFSKSKILHYIIIFTASILLLVHMSFNKPIDASIAIIKGFSFTEYLTIFIAFIYGSIASRFFSGWGVIILKYDRITYSKEHLVWTILMFGLLLDFWVSTWERINYISLDFMFFVFSLSVPIAFYALTAVLFPVIKNNDKIDLVDFYLSHRKIIFILFGVTILTNAITANVIEHDLMHIRNIFRLIALLLTLVIYFTRKRWVERGILTLGCLLFFVLVLRDLIF
jgi:hypothetical protein